MSDFLQSLVLRAAGLPLTAAPVPRMLPAAEPVEMAAEEETEQPASEHAPIVRERVDGERRTEASRTPPEILAPEGAPPSVIEQFNVVHEQAHEVRELEPPPVEARPIAEAPPSLTSPLLPQIIEREVIREREHAAPRDTPAASMTVQPPPSPIEVPHETIVERELAAAPSAESTALDREQAPVVLQPIVIDQTRTIVEPLREERTVIETRTERVVEPAVEHPETMDAQEPERPRAEIEPRVDSPRIEARAETPQPVERPEMLVEPVSEDERPAEAVPRTLVLPQPPSASEIEEAQLQPEPEVAIHIGTIEIRAAAPPPPAPAPQSVTITRAPEPPSNFDAYASVRNYVFPDVW